LNKVIVAIDQGTSSTRCMVFDQFARVITSAQMEHHQHYPQPGWVEHDAMEIWNNTVSVTQQALSQANLTSHEIGAVGITNQRETTLLWDRHTGKPFGHAIVWQDTRTDIICNALGKSGGQYRFAPKTGLPLATYFSGPKIKWILDNNAEARHAAQAGDAIFGNMDTWLIWNLTGGPGKGIHVTDVTNASRTLLMNLSTLDWDDEILATLGIPPSILPEIKPSSYMYGECKGLLDGVPVAGDLGDQQAALFGQTCFQPGDAKNTYGTGCFMLLNTGTTPLPSKNGLLTTLGYQIGSQPAVYCLEGSIAITGALVQWMRDNLKMIESSAEIETLALSVENNGGMYIVPAFSGLFAPYWRSDARGVITGLTRYVHRGHFARAVLESTAYQTREIVEAMEHDSGIPLTQLKVDGGMVKNELLMQFQSDILNVPVIRPTLTETTALGAAYAAGLAVGYWKDQQELQANWQMDKEWKPSMPLDESKRLYSGWKKAVTRTFNWID
jgi:glycerol kinase